MRGLRFRWPGTVDVHIWRESLIKKASVGYVKDVDLMRHGITPQKVPTVAAVTGVAEIRHQTLYRFQYVSIIGSVGECMSSPL
jgi:hypothetical protein